MFTTVLSFNHISLVDAIPSEQLGFEEGVIKMSTYITLNMASKVPGIGHQISIPLRILWGYLMSETNTLYAR